jgi:RNA polymerase sigma-70 factor (ECF subfamily)
MSNLSAARITSVDHEFVPIVRSHAGRLFAIAFTILQDRGDAEDAVQEVMLIAWQGWAKTSPYADARPWLNKICVNHCLSRRSVLRLRIGRTAALDLSLAAPEPVAGDTQLSAAYEGLSRRQRAVVLLHYHFGYSLDECAEMMNCRPGTARSHLHRALKALREAMSHD